MNAGRVTRKDAAPYFEFTIIGGRLKGRKITAPNLGVTRPPLSRLRKSIFDFLVPYIGEARYLDLFSGTGSYLFEAVSRGAIKATGVELESELADAINRQAYALGIADRLHCLQEDVFKALPSLASLGERHDIIMLAPPQYKGIVDQTLMALKESDLLAPRGMIICQHDRSESSKTDFHDWLIRQQRTYGNTTFTVLEASLA